MAIAERPARGRIFVAFMLAVLAACGPRPSDGFSGTVQAPSAAVGSTIGGTVSAVLVRDGSRVRAGETIVAFDASQELAIYRSALASARSARAAVADLAAGSRAPDLERAQSLAQQQRQTYKRAQLSAAKQIVQLDDRIRQDDANVATARAAAHDAQTDAEREITLFATGDVSGQTRDAAVSRAKQSQGQLAAASAAASSSRTQRANAAEVTIPREAAAALEGYRAAEQGYDSLAIGARPDALDQARASAAAAFATAADAKARLDQMIVRAPAAGVVSALDLHVGDLVAQGASVATIDEIGEPFVRVYVPQSQLARWEVGAAVVVRPDSSPGSTVRGTVEAVDAQAQFTPQNVQTADDRADLSFGVKVRIHDRGHPLHGGTTATVLFTLSEATAIDVRGLSKRYGARTVVNGLSLQVSRGEIFGFLGPNGSGKSTTIKMLCGLVKPSGGSASICGLDVASQGDKVRHKIGYMSQSFSLYDDLTVYENLEFYGRGVWLAESQARKSASTRWSASRTSTHIANNSRARSRAAGSSGSRSRARCCTSRDVLFLGRTDGRHRFRSATRVVGFAFHAQRARCRALRHDALHGRSGTLWPGRLHLEW